MLRFPAWRAYSIERRSGSRIWSQRARTQKVVAMTNQARASLSSGQRVDVRQLEPCSEDEILAAESFSFVPCALECDAARLPVLAGVGEDAPPSEKCVHVLRARLRQQPLRTFEKVRRSGAVAAVVGAPPCPREQLPCTRGVATVVVRDRPELHAVLERLLEVVAEDLVELDELGAIALEP
jgi:hypothetical protein